VRLLVTGAANASLTDAAFIRQLNEPVVIIGSDAVERGRYLPTLRARSF
jgi:hypothetical protein